MTLSVEAHFSQKLADNVPDNREKALKEIGEWFETVSVTSAVLDEDILLKIWKGLYYYFWHCDKMLVQEEKAEVISQYIHNFRSVKLSFLYLETFFKTMAREWHGIDRFRLDKFMMLTRFLLRQGFQLVRNHKWEVKFIKGFLKALKSTVLNPSSKSVPFGLKSHITDIYMEELTQVGADEVTPKILRQFLLPYCRILCCSDDYTFLTCIEKDIFLYLINQEADEEDFGEFPVLQFKPTAVQKLLMKFANKLDVKRKNRRVIHSIVKGIENYKNGINVFEDALERHFDDTVKPLGKKDVKKAALDLLEEEKKYKELKKAYKKKKVHTDKE